MVSKAWFALMTIFEPALRGVEPSSSMMVTNTQGSPRFCRSARASIQLYMFTSHDRSHARRGNASLDAPRPLFTMRRRASRAAFPRRAWERSNHYLRLSFDGLHRLQLTHLLTAPQHPLRRRRRVDFR